MYTRIFSKVYRNVKKRQVVSKLGCCVTSFSKVSIYGKEQFRLAGVLPMCMQNFFFIFQINFITNLIFYGNNFFTKSPALLHPHPQGDFKYLCIHKINLGKLDNHYYIIYNYLKIQFLLTKAPI